MAQQPLVGKGLLIIEASRSHSDSSGQVISPTQRPLPDNTQHPQETNIHASGGIRTHNPGKRTAADLRLRPRAHWDRQGNKLVQTFLDRAGMLHKTTERPHLLFIFNGKPSRGSWTVSATSRGNVEQPRLRNTTGERERHRTPTSVYICQ
jgi:hypothetical protein